MRWEGRRWREGRGGGGREGGRGGEGGGFFSGAEEDSWQLMERSSVSKSQYEAAGLLLIPWGTGFTNPTILHDFFSSKGLNTVLLSNTAAHFQFSQKLMYNKKVSYISL